MKRTPVQHRDGSRWEAELSPLLFSFPYRYLPEELSDASLLSSVDEAKQLVDAAYKHTRDR